MTPRRRPVPRREISPLGRFVEREEIGRGSSGHVWRVDDPARPGRRLALKILDDRSAASAVREWRSGASIRHPAIVEILEIGTLPASSAHEGAPYLLSEYVDGVPLKPLWTCAELHPVAWKLLDALAHIHASGWRHGDLKPQNILVCRGTNECSVRILDFGLASELASPTPHKNGGTPPYIAPECLAGALPDRRADLYALGLLLFECLSGQLAGKLSQILLEARSGALHRRISDGLEGTALESLVRGLTHPDPSSRIGSAEEGLSLLGETRTSASRVRFESGDVIGQDEIVSAIDHAIGEVTSQKPAPNFLLIHGDAGSGKSRLLREAALRGIQRGVHHVDGLSLESIDPDRVLSDAKNDRTDSLSLLSGGAAATTFNRMSRTALAITEILTSRPSLWTIDDLERRSPEELSVIAAVIDRIRRSRSSRVAAPPFILVGTRDDPIGTEKLSAWWSELEPLSWVHRSKISSWAADETREFLDRVLRPRRELQWLDQLLIRDSMGNPGRLRGFLQALQARGELALDGQTWRCSRVEWKGLPPPEDDSSRAFEEWSSRSAVERDALGLCAIWWTTDRGPTSRELASALSVPLVEIAETIRALARLEILRLEGKEATGFRLARQARLRILRNIQPEGRRRIRDLWTTADVPTIEQIAQEIAIRHVNFERIESALDGDSLQGERILFLHARSRHTPLDQRAKSFERCGQLAEQRGAVNSARKYWILALESRKTEPVPARCLLHIARCELALGRNQEAGERLNELRISNKTRASRSQESEDEESFLHALWCVQTGRLSESLEIADSALASRPDDPALLNLVANASLRLGDLGRSETAFRAALKVARRRNSREEQGALLSGYARLLLARGEVRKSIEEQRASCELLEATGSHYLEARAWGNLGAALRRVSEYDEALEATNRSLEIHRRSGDRRGAAVAEASLGILSAELGVLGAAWRQLESARAGLEADSSQPVPLLLSESQARLAIELGEDRRLAQCLSERPGSSVRPASSITAESLRLECALVAAGQGDWDTLERWLEERPSRVEDSSALVEIALTCADYQDAGRPEDTRARVLTLARSRLASTSDDGPAGEELAHLVELAIDGSESEIRPDVVPNLWKHTTMASPRDRRRIALWTLARRAPMSNDRHRAKMELRTLVDEVLLDLDPRQRRAYRARKDISKTLILVNDMSLPDTRKNGSLELVREICQLNREILEERDIDTLFSKIVAAALRLTGAERGALVLRRRARLHFVAARVADGELVAPEEHISRTIIERALEEDAAQLTVDAREDLSLRSIASVEELGLRSVLCVPLRARGSKWRGALYLDNSFERGVFSTDDLELAESFCAQAAVAWTSAETRRSLEELVAKQEEVQRGLEIELESSRRETDRRKARDQNRLEGIIGRSRTMRQLFDWIETVAPTNLPILITGDSGTGKELVARALHSLSRRAHSPFVAENCAAIPSNLIESVLFGHVKGAFTGALTASRGLFELASGGSLFLDEIAELDADLQTRLLRVLQEGEIRPLGSERTRKVDVRIITATNRNTARAVEEGRLRNDLYYRLQGAEIHIPALRERADDIPLLVEHFLGDLDRSEGPCRISAEALDFLGSYDWPGNVRELQNEVRRAAILCSGSVIRPEHLSPTVREPKAAAPSALATNRAPTEVLPLKETEQAAIRGAMEQLGGRRGEVARALGISRSTLYLKLREMEGTV